MSYQEAPNPGTQRFPIRIWTLDLADWQVPSEREILLLDAHHAVPGVSEISWLQLDQLFPKLQLQYPI
jgi:hypothetical protein